MYHTKNPWEGVDIIKGKPIQGMKGTIRELRKQYKIIVYSSRCSETKGMVAIAEWLFENGIEIDGIVCQKPSYASAFIDDRGINFDGNCKKLIKNIDELLKRKSK